MLRWRGDGRGRDRRAGRRRRGEGRRPRRGRAADQYAALCRSRDRLPAAGGGRILPGGPDRAARVRRDGGARSARCARCTTTAPAPAWRSRAKAPDRCWCRSPAACVPVVRCRRPAASAVVPPDEIVARSPATARGRHDAHDLARLRADPVPGDVPGAARPFAGRPGAADAASGRCDAVDIRDFATDRHRTVDDTPFGGGAGMVLRPDVVDAAHRARSPTTGPLVFLTPRGRPLTQATCARFAAGPGVILLCGRYEGVDQRVIEARGMQEVCIGDYVLSGGELAGAGAARRRVRLLPGVMGAADSAGEESFSRRPAGIPALHAPGRMAGPRACPTCCSPATTPRSPPGARPRPNASPANAAPICGRAHGSHSRGAGCQPGDGRRLRTSTKGPER